jgi:hypothetical protein
MSKSGFSVGPFKSRKHDFRADKGKKHHYPEQRKQWNFSHGQTEANLSKYDSGANCSVMDTAKQFKNPPEIREYWRVHKAKERQLEAHKK